MRKLLYALFSSVLFISFAAVASDVAPPGPLFAPLTKDQARKSKRRFAGAVLSAESVTVSTTDRLAFGFTSNWVSLCLQGGTATATSSIILYFRFEQNASTALWADRTSTGSAAYIAGTILNGPGGNAALTITGGGDGTDARCMSIPIQARGITIHNVSSATGTLDVNAW